MSQDAQTELLRPVLLTEEAHEMRRRRRALLETTPNPARRHGEPVDYLVFYEARLDSIQAFLRLTYAPGKLILTPDALQRYLDALDRDSTLPVEALAHVVLDDMNDELVPRWVQIVVEQPAEAGRRALTHRVLVEDREPRWDDPALLARAPRL